MDTQHHPLFDDYTYVVLSAPAFAPLFQRYRPVVFGQTFGYQPEDTYNVQEARAARRLQQQMSGRYRLRIGIYYQETVFAGWTVGWQRDSDVYYMANTGILPQHQNRGIYTHLLPTLLSIIGKEGFQVVESRHTASNNRVIIPKLKAGFVISGLEVSDQFGTLVWLRYFFNETRRRMMDVRTGEHIPDDELRQLLHLP
ncbi:MAG: GNAT family N-acetyltransferase [Chloroflexota bacterium]